MGLLAVLDDGDEGETGVLAVGPAVAVLDDGGQLISSKWVPMGAYSTLRCGPKMYGFAVHAGVYCVYVLYCPKQ
jgi:hypothetical protein